MEMNIRAATQEERAYSYSQDKDVMRKAGCIGHLRGDMDTDGNSFFTTWDDHNAELKTKEFKAEFDDVINGLRFDEQYGGLLKNRSSLSAYCHKHPESAFEGNYTAEYGFRIDTDEHSYMLRCNPNKGDYNFYCYAYNREMLDEVLLPAPDLMQVVKIEPGQPAYVTAIKSSLESLQMQVDGFIQAVYPYEDAVALLCNEEAKLDGLPLNRALRDEDGDIYDVVAGNFLIVGLGDENFCGLSDDLAKKYKDMFKTPEMFIRMNGKLVVLPMKEDTREKRPSVLGKLESAKQQNSPSVGKKPHEKEER